MRRDSQHLIRNNLIERCGQNGIVGQRGLSSSIVASSFSTGFSIVDDSNGVTVTFKTDDAPQRTAGPIITRDYIGINSITKQGIEDRDGNPITVDKSILGGSRDAPTTAGSFENLAAGTHTYRFTAGPARSSDPSAIAVPRKTGIRLRNFPGGNPTIFDITGRKTLPTKGSQSRGTGIQSLPQGVYFVKHDGEEPAMKTMVFGDR